MKIFFTDITVDEANLGLVLHVGDHAPRPPGTFLLHHNLLDQICRV